MLTVASPVNARIPPMAIDCQFLRRTIDSSRTTDPYVMMCTHIVRDGEDCIGPFLDDVETDCKLWEANGRLRARYERSDPPRR